MPYYLGIDGGGTKTVAWLADGDGTVLARAESGPSNPCKVGLAPAERAILQASRACLRQAGLPASGLASGKAVLHGVCAGIAGVDRPTVQRPLLAWMRVRLPARRHRITSDAAIALAAAVRDGAGIIVIAGTGSIAFARDPQGSLLRAGGWGIPYDDRGSGYELGRAAVAAALEAHDGRGASTLLAHRIARHFKLRAITGIIAKQLEPQDVAALFPLVEQAAQEGDTVARHLCENAARDLASLALTLLKRLGGGRQATPVVTTGGVFRSSALIRRSFARHVSRFAPQARVEMLERPPVEGALWLARSRERKKAY